MSTFLMPPRPQGTAEEQLQRQYAYLFQMAQGLNLALEGLGSAGSGGETALRPAAAAEKSAYESLKSLILRTAREVRQEMDKVALELRGEYVAVSDFGTYLQQLNSRIEGDGAAITQYYRFLSELQTNVEAVSAAFERYRVDTEGYIRTGIVYYEGAVPVYGVAVGQDLAVSEIDGQQVVEQKNFRATYTAGKLSFWQDATEVAYVSNNRLYIGDITVLRSVTLGKWQMEAGNGLAWRWIGG